MKILATTEDKYVLNLELTKYEAELLMGMMQNPQIFAELPVVLALAEGIFNSLASQGVTPK